MGHQTIWRHNYHLLCTEQRPSSRKGSEGFCWDRSEVFPAKWSTTSNGRPSIRECASMNSSGSRDGYDGKTVLPVRIFVCGLKGGAKRAG